jgi:hypothetical protein
MEEEKRAQGKYPKTPKSSALRYKREKAESSSV